MKNVLLLLTLLLAGFQVGNASTDAKATSINNFRDVNSFIFVENGVTFSVYPDGEFDFFIEDRVPVRAGVRAGGVAITFNSGFNYDPFVQYDDYGAVIQVENIPIYYDPYGRVDQIGSVDIRYRNGLVRRVGNLRVFYRGGYFSHYTGYVNVYNRNFFYRPFYRYFARPAVGFCMVYNYPYREFYFPTRFTYYRPYHYNPRWSYARVGEYYTYRPHRERATYYRNDRRVRQRSDNYYRQSRPQYRSNTRVRDGYARRSDGREIRAVDRSQVRSNTTARRAKESYTGRSVNRGRNDNGQLRERSSGNRKPAVTRRSSVEREQDNKVRQRSRVATKSDVRRSRSTQDAGRSYKKNDRPAVKRSQVTQRSTAARKKTESVQRNRSQVDRSRNQSVRQRSSGTNARKPQARQSSRSAERYSKGRSVSSPTKSRSAVSRRSTSVRKAHSSPQRSQSRSATRSRSNLRNM